MEVHYDSDLESIENFLSYISVTLGELIGGTGALHDPEISDIYGECVNRINTIAEDAGRLHEDFVEARKELHRNPEFNRVYFEAFGTYHPDGDIVELDVAEEEAEEELPFGVREEIEEL